MATTIPIPAITIKQALDHKIDAFTKILKDAKAVQPNASELEEHNRMLANLEDEIEEARPLLYHIRQGINYYGGGEQLIAVDINDFDRFGLNNLKLYG